MKDSLTGRSVVGASMYLDRSQMGPLKVRGWKPDADIDIAS